MRRIQLHLTDRQDKLLQALAQRTHLTRAELIRRGIDLVLRHDATEDPLLGLIGAAGAAGRNDLSERHDEVLYTTDVARPRLSAKRKGQRP